MSSGDMVIFCALGCSRVFNKVKRGDVGFNLINNTREVSSSESLYSKRSVTSWTRSVPFE